MTVEVELMTAIGYSNVIMSKRVALPIAPFVGMEIYERVGDDDHYIDGEYTVTDVTVDLLEGKINCGIKTTLNRDPVEEQIAKLGQLGWEVE